MKRRQYLGAAAAGGVVGVAGVSAYTVLQTDGVAGPPPVAEAEFPPYPEPSEVITRSGEGTGTSEPFELVHEGPTIIETSVDHDADDIYNIELNSTEDETIRGVVQARGPFTGRTNVPPVPPGGYELDVTDAAGSWEATIYDLSVYEDGTGMELPFTFSDGLDTVIGPIDFGDPQPVAFTFEVDADSRHRLDIVDRNGVLFDTVIQAQTAGERTRVPDTDLGGVGYLDLKSFTTWTLEVSPHTADGN